MPVEAVEGAAMPGAAVVMLNTRLVNGWLGTSYTLDEVEAMDPLTFEVLTALRQGLEGKG